MADLAAPLTLGALGLAGVLAALVRRDDRLVECDDDGLHVGARSYPWSRIVGLDFVHGGHGTTFVVATRTGRVRFDDERCELPVHEVKRAIVDGAGLERDVDALPEDRTPRLPGDVFERWVREACDDEQDDDGEAREPGRGRGGTFAGVGALLALLAKSWKGVLAALKASELTSVVPTLVSGAASAWVYAQLGGWRFALGLVGLLVVHELGHAAVMVAKRLRTTPIVFVPMFGAFIAIKDQFRDASVEAETALGGPVAGALLATACLGAALLTGDPFWAALAFFGGILNLFNLLPISPLDGGRVVTAISTWLWILGLAAIAALAALTAHPLLVLVAMLGGLRAWRTWRRGRPRDDEYYALSPRYRVVLGVTYFAVCGYLAWLTAVARPLADVDVT